MGGSPDGTVSEGQMNLLHSAWRRGLTGGSCTECWGTCGVQEGNWTEATPELLNEW